MAELDRLVCIDDLHEEARAQLSPEAYDYYASGALTEATLSANRRAFERWRFRRRVLVDVSQLDLRTEVLGAELAFPVIVAPTALHRLAHPDGELATARGTASVGTLMVSSTLASVAMEQVAATGVPGWFQLYVTRDRSITSSLVNRAVSAGFRAIVLTVDAPRIGVRWADQRNRFSLPDGVRMETLESSFPDAAESGLRAFSEQFDDSLTFDDLAELCATCPLPVIPKGIVTGDDARRAVEAGAAAVIVSNHGGRQLDRDRATLDALPEVAEAVGDQVPVLMDGGVRTGADVVTALALGARAVLVGRPVLWGLAAGGEEGVAHALGILRDEVAEVLRQAGVASVSAVGRDLVEPTPHH